MTGVPPGLPASGTPLVEVSGASFAYGARRVLRGRVLRGAGRRCRGAGRPQRRRQVHAGAAGGRAPRPRLRHGAPGRARPARRAAPPGGARLRPRPAGAAAAWPFTVREAVMMGRAAHQGLLAVPGRFDHGAWRARSGPATSSTWPDRRARRPLRRRAAPRLLRPGPGPGAARPPARRAHRLPRPRPPGGGHGAWRRWRPRAGCAWWRCCTTSTCRRRPATGWWSLRARARRGRGRAGRGAHRRAGPRGVGRPGLARRERRHRAPRWCCRPALDSRGKDLEARGQGRARGVTHRWWKSTATPRTSPRRRRRTTSPFATLLEQPARTGNLPPAAPPPRGVGVLGSARIALVSPVAGRDAKRGRPDDRATAIRGTRSRGRRGRGCAGPPRVTISPTCSRPASTVAA